MVGVPYRYGGSDPASGFDCSGLVYYSYREAGLAVPRSSQDLFSAVTKIALDDAEPGDLIFFQDQESCPMSASIWETAHSCMRLRRVST